MSDGKKISNYLLSDVVRNFQDGGCQKIFVKFLKKIFVRNFQDGGFPKKKSRTLKSKIQGRQKTMSFSPELIKVSKSNDKYSNLVHGKDTITFALKDCYSHFGLAFNKKFKNYSIGINVKDKLFGRLRAVEEKAKEFLDRPLSKPLLRCLVERD